MASRLRPTPLGGTTAAAFEAILRTNLTAVFLTVQGALPLMQPGGAMQPGAFVERDDALDRETRRRLSRERDCSSWRPSVIRAVPLA